MLTFKTFFCSSCQDYEKKYIEEDKKKKGERNVRTINLIKLESGSGQA